MEHLPAHIRPDDEIYFRKPLPLKPMNFRARWILGLKVLVAAQLVWLPIALFFSVVEHFGDRLSAFVFLGGLLVCIVLGPLWAAGLFRGWVASSMAQRLLSQVLAPPEDTLQR